ncbi:isoprenylcysteine carboxylmethyltransferase family protein [Sphingomonas limnosediminicola]|uniref:Isoprenylcysteine carboxylmethyltransferase family protein n=1 Tax=Sphingomonas limnosediminicola TaxID=940133 RepID=A0ABP7LHC8_9SPHN
MTNATDGANVRFPPPLIYVGGLAVGIGADRLLNLPTLGLPIMIRSIVGGSLDVTGFLVMFAGAGLFLRRRTAILPFKPASSLVTSGILRWTRNPMYLGMAIFYVGLAVILNSLAALILLPLVLAIVQKQVIAKEEAYLERAFGHEYLAYKERVGRWL